MPAQSRRRSSGWSPAAGSSSDLSSKPSSRNSRRACAIASHRWCRHRNRCARDCACAPSTSAQATKVITSPLSAAYTALAIQMVGARPVFADIDPERLTLDPAAVAAAVTTHTAAIMPVHLYGQAADMPALDEGGLASRVGGDRGLLPGSPGDLRRSAGWILRRRRRIQFLSDKKSRCAGGWRRSDDRRCGTGRPGAAHQERWTERPLPPRRVRGELTPRRNSGGDTSSAAHSGFQRGPNDVARSPGNTGPL